MTPACFGWMVQQLMTVGHGKVRKKLLYPYFTSHHTLCAINTLCFLFQVVLALEGEFY